MSLAAGKVTIVGAGPGDPGLLTVRGLQALGQADLLLYDPAVPPSLLAQARPECRRVEAPAAPFPEEAWGAVAEAGEGRSVCWLVPGDPFLHGAVVAVALALQERGIPFEVVPGVASELAVLTHAGIPAVGPSMPPDLAIVDSEDPFVPWAHIAQGVDTILIRLRGARPGDVARRLVQSGRATETPAALITAGTLPEQQVLVGTLGALQEQERLPGGAAQGVLVVGRVVQYRERLDFSGAVPLRGRCVLITRSAEQAGPMVEQVHRLGGTAFLFPVITVADPESWAPLDEAIAEIDRYRWLVITSPNGAERFAGRLKAAGKDGQALAHLRVVAVGTATARRLERLGIGVDLIPKQFRGAALPDAMGPYLQPGDRVLMARANLADPATADALRALGAEVDDIVAYRTVQDGGDVEALRQALAAGRIDYATFTSGSTVRNLIARLGGTDLLRGVRIACIGPETAKVAEEAGLPVHLVASPHTIEGLMEAIAADCRQSGRTA